MTDVIDLVRRSREAATRRIFENRVDTQAATLRADIEAGHLDNGAFSIGLELEVYAVDSENRLTPVPKAVLDVCTKELGVHNAELNTAPSVFDEAGLAAQERELRERFDAAQAAARAKGARLVLDALWTIPPAEGTHAYLGDVSERDGVVIANGMRTDARYHALDNDVLDRSTERSVRVPGGEVRVGTVFIESLATSMQPHLLVPSAAAFPTYFNAAIRTLGPVLALCTNAPFLPADCYDLDRSGSGTLDGTTGPIEAVERAPHELRIAVFENAMNVESPGKVGVPRDVTDTEEIVTRLLCDRVCGPFLREWATSAEHDAGVETDSSPQNSLGSDGIESDTDEEYAARLWELDYKRSTYWRWVRPVFSATPIEGACGERSLRIEYRALPAQPSLADVTSLSVLVVGLLRGLVATDHPLASLPWDEARACFYGVSERGFDADLAWVNAEGERVNEVETVYEDLFSVARRGLAEAEISANVADAYLKPLEARVAARTAPSDWKKREVGDRVEGGATLSEAIRGMQCAYIERAGEPFAEWL